MPSADYLDIGTQNADKKINLDLLKNTCDWAWQTQSEKDNHC